MHWAGAACAWQGSGAQGGGACPRTSGWQRGGAVGLWGEGAWQARHWQWQGGQTEQARAGWVELVRRAPSYSKPRKNLRQLHRVLARRAFDARRYQEAVAHYKALFALQGGSPPLREAKLGRAVASGPAPARFR